MIWSRSFNNELERTSINVVQVVSTMRCSQA